MNKSTEELNLWPWLWAGGAIFLIVLGLIALGNFIWGQINPPPRVEQQLLNALSPACEGRPVEQAAVLTEGPGPHPAVLLDSSGDRHSWTDKLPTEWWPASVNATELVVCVGEEEKVKMETCEYRGGPDVVRYRYDVEVRVVEARTGDTLDHSLFSGSDPRECREREDIDLEELNGSHVPFKEAEAWLRRHVLGGNE